MSESTTASAGASAGSTTSQGSSQSSAGSMQSSSSSQMSQGQSAGQSASAGQDYGSTNPNPNAQSRGEGQQGSETQEQSKPSVKKLGDQDMDALVTVKIDGVTQELPLREVVKIQQLEKASQAKMQQAAAERRRAEEILKMDIDQFAKLRGLDIDSLAEERLAKKYELMQMTPEQRELMELRQYREGISQQEMAAKNEVIDQIKQFVSDLPQGIENATQEQLHGYLAHVQQQYKSTETALEQELVNAWKESGLPKHKYFGALMAFHMMNHQKVNGEPLQAAQAAAKVKGEFVNHTREILSAMDAKAIHDMLGKELMSKLREYDVQRVTAGHAASNAPKSPGSQPASAPKKYLNQMEWRQAMGLE